MSNLQLSSVEKKSEPNKVFLIQIRHLKISKKLCQAILSNFSRNVKNESSMTHMGGPESFKFAGKAIFKFFDIPTQFNQKSITSHAG